MHAIDPEASSSEFPSVAVTPPPLSWNTANRLLVEEAEDLATGVLAARLLVVHDAERGRQDDVSKPTCGKQVVYPLLDILERHVEPGGDDTALVDTAGQLYNDLPRAVVVHDLELPYVAVLLHNLQELDHNLGAWPDQHLPLPALLRVGDGLQSVFFSSRRRHTRF